MYWNPVYWQRHSTKMLYIIHTHTHTQNFKIGENLLPLDIYDHNQK